MDRLVAIGDIHGCVHTLKDLLNRVSYSSQTDTLVFIGDYIDRGYFSYEVDGLRHCHLFTTPQRLFSVMPACPIPCCKITARKIFCGDAIGFKQIQKNEKSKLYLDTHQGLTEEPTQSQQETYVLMLGVYTMAAYVRSSSKTTDKAPVCM